MEFAGYNVACSKGTSSSCNFDACSKRRRCNRFASYRSLLAVLVAAWILPTGTATDLAISIADASTASSVEAITEILTTEDNYNATTALPTSFLPQIAEPATTITNETVPKLCLANTITILTTTSTTPKPDATAELVGNEIFAVPEDMSVFKEVKQSPDFIESQHEQSEAGSTKDLEQTIRNSVKTEIEMEQNLDGILDVLKDIPESDVRQTLTDEILSVEYPQKSEEEPSREENTNKSEEAAQNLTTFESQLTTKPSTGHRAESNLREARNLNTASIPNGLEADEVGDMEMQNLDNTRHTKVVGLVSEDSNNIEETLGDENNILHVIHATHESHETKEQNQIETLDEKADDQILIGLPKQQSEDIIEKENIIEDSYSDPATGKVKADEAFLEEHKIKTNLIEKELSADFKESQKILEKEGNEKLENKEKDTLVAAQGHDETTADDSHENPSITQNEVESLATNELTSSLATTSTEQPSAAATATNLSPEVNQEPTEFSIVLEESLTPTEPPIQLQDLVDEPEDTKLTSGAETTPVPEIIHHVVIKKEGAILDAELDNDIEDMEITTILPALVDVLEPKIKDDSAELPLEVELPLNDLNETQETATENTWHADEQDSTALSLETTTELAEPTAGLPQAEEVIISISTEPTANKGSRSIVPNAEEKAVASTFLEALPSRIAGQALEDNLTAESGEQVGKPVSASSMMDLTTNRSFVIILLCSSTALLFIVILVTIFLVTFRSQHGTLDIEMQEQRCGKDITDEVELGADIGTTTKLLEIELPNKNNSIEIAEIDEAVETDECL